MLEPFLRNFADNPIVVQFVHRWLAFVVARLAPCSPAAAWKRGHQAREARALVGAVALQILLGILTLLSAASSSGSPSRTRAWPRSARGDR